MIARSLLAICLLLPEMVRAEPAKPFRAGAFAINVTPEKFPISVNGGMGDRMVKLVNDPLHVRCLVFDDGTTKLAVVVVDSCMIPRELVEDAKQQASKLTGIPKANMLISATHTHSAPTLGSVFQSNPDPDYTRFLAAKIAQGIDRANKNLAPAKIGWGVGKDPTQLFNRRWKREQAFMPQNPFGENTDQVQMNPGHLAKGLIEPAGPIDPDVSIIAVQSKSGKPLALLANYSLHYVGGNPDLSADYFGIRRANRHAPGTGQRQWPLRGHHVQWHQWGCE